MITIYQKLKLIFEGHFYELRSEKEKQFIGDMIDGLDGVPFDINDEDVTEYLSPNQITWINEIAEYLSITN